MPFSCWERWERWFKNTSGLDAKGLCKAYAECDKPFVEMGKYGERIEAADHASIEQGSRLDFSIEFYEETDQLTIFDGEKEENRKAQDKPAAKPSLKARLAEKKAQVAGQGREQEENIKK